MLVGFNGNFQLGSDPVIGGDKKRITIAGRLEIKDTTEPSD